MRAEGYQRRRQELAGWPVVIVSYRLDERFICEIESAGARLARAAGASREAAEQAAMATGSARLARTRVQQVE
jgi:dsRNA-specific ribonuclease